MRPTITELEKMMDDGMEVELLPNGEVVERRRMIDPPFPGYIVKAGDDHASIFWTGVHWSRCEADAVVYSSWRAAKRVMARLRDSSGTTIRTKNVGETRDPALAPAPTPEPRTKG